MIEVVNNLSKSVRYECTFINAEGSLVEAFTDQHVYTVIVTIVADMIGVEINAECAPA